MLTIWRQVDVLSNYVFNPESWKNQLEDQSITDDDIKKSLISLHNPLLHYHIIDYKARIVLHKTRFCLQINKYKDEEEPWCQTCKREDGI